VRIDPSSHEPIYLQIVAEVRKAIAAGVYKPGEMLPSLRVLALDLRVNPNTVQRAYDELERDGVVTVKRGVGLFVAERDSRLPRGDAEKAMSTAFRQGVRTARDAGLPVERIRAVFEHALEQPQRKAPSRP
jgi:GntR family transcriptional regulator